METIISRGAVYCTADFPVRAAAWFRQQRQEQDRHRPTRIQPPRAVKRRATWTETAEGATTGDYALEWPRMGGAGEEEGPGKAADEAADFGRRVAALMAALQTALAQRRRQQLLPALPAWACPLAGQALDCSAPAGSCLHGVDAAEPPVVPTARMAPGTPLEWRNYLAERADMWAPHADEAGELGGLRFVVDACAGGVVVMV